MSKVAAGHSGIPTTPHPFNSCSDGVGAVAKFVGQLLRRNLSTQRRRAQLRTFCTWDLGEVKEIAKTYMWRVAITPDNPSVAGHFLEAFGYI